ncbi:diacylglycerol kinase family protein [uncultured Ferrovibrio sp.]|jgi:diacylglycerol kinase (ATP)|uniref:diacylglycerol/lipid kinase family protein n=1 Tax=uncultured Ferrovibrio sp. TaxID=1576913 RepID=UPI002638605A|nr:diacylglycerol kinase family protein [uncultured Ferrovibrio sp.]
MPVSQRRRLLVIYNPAAGSGRLNPRRRARLQAWLDLLKDAGCAAEFRPTTRRGDAERFAAEALAARYDAVVAAGGDGTIGEIANGLPEDAAPLGILPLGTANVLALEIGLPLGPSAATQALLHGPVARIWPGYVNDRLFTIMAGIGFDAHVVAALSPRQKFWLGKGAYVIETLRQFIRYDGPGFRLAIDGVDYACASAVIAKGHFYGGKFVCAPHARLNDPAFEVCLFRKSGRAGVLRAAAALMLGRLHRLPEIELVRGHRIDIFGPKTEPVQADGDIVTYLPAKVRIGARAIKLIVPPGSALAQPMAASAGEAVA